MRILKFDEFEAWMSEISVKLRGQVDARLDRIVEDDHFGDTRYLGDGLAELKWKNGLRVYYSKGTDVAGNVVLVILGGTKNGQQKDIKKARLLLREYAER